MTYPTTIEAYVCELGARLSGPRRLKADLLAEARNGLVDAVTALRHQGTRDTALRQQGTRDTALCQQGICGAEARAVSEFGPVDVIARAYQSELGLAQSRRTALLVVLVLAVQPFVWGIGRQAVIGQAIPVDPAVYAVKALGGLAMLAAIGVLVLSGIGLRYAAAEHSLARLVGRFGLIVVVTLTAFSVVLTARGSSVPVFSAGGLPWTLAFLIVPLGVVAASARRCLRCAG